jgi:hypothetical protein
VQVSVPEGSLCPYISINSMAISEQTKLFRAALTAPNDAIFQLQWESSADTCADPKLIHPPITFQNVGDGSETVSRPGRRCFSFPSLLPSVTRQIRIRPVTLNKQYIGRTPAGLPAPCWDCSH